MRVGDLKAHGKICCKTSACVTGPVVHCLGCMFLPVLDQMIEMICTFVENKKKGGNDIIDATKTWYSVTIVGMNHGSHPHYKDNFVTKLYYIEISYSTIGV